MPRSNRSKTEFSLSFPDDIIDAVQAEAEVAEVRTSSALRAIIIAAYAQGLIGRLIHSGADEMRARSIPVFYSEQARDRWVSSGSRAGPGQSSIWKRGVYTLARVGGGGMSEDTTNAETGWFLTGPDLAPTHLGHVVAEAKRRADAIITDRDSKRWKEEA